MLIIKMQTQDAIDETQQKTLIKMTINRDVANIVKTDHKKLIEYMHIQYLEM